MATQLVTQDQAQQQVALSPAQQHFQLMQRKAQLFANSPLIPETLRAGGPQQALANCYIGLTMAEAMGENPLTVLQNIHVVKGKAGFSAQFMIARANASNIFKGRIDWRIEGKGDGLSVTAFAFLADTGQEVSVTCDMAMAKAEGWTSNPKYKSMPEVMLRYRSATFLVRFYAPDVMFGYQTAEEVEDVSYAAGPDLAAKPLTGAMLLEQASPDRPAPGEGSADAVETPNDSGEQAAPEQGRGDSDMGEGFTDPLAALKLEIDGKEIIHDVNAIVRRESDAAILDDDQMDTLRAWAADRCEAIARAA